MLKWMGLSIAALTLGWIIIQRSQMSWISLAAGVALSCAFFMFLSFFVAEKPAPTFANERSEWQKRLEDAEIKASHAREGLTREMQKLQQKAIRAEERCLSYQKLVEVHQQEIEKLRADTQNLAEQLTQKERKLSEFYLSKVEPDLFDTQRREVESINRELKKQLLDTKSELAQLVQEPRKEPRKKKKNLMPELESRDLLG